MKVTNSFIHQTFKALFNPQLIALKAFTAQEVGHDSDILIFYRNTGHWFDRLVKCMGKKGTKALAMYVNDY